ncbi:MAG: PH domain-containing protein [Burkholderiales bacterium]|nr:MAG: PH domain-containing protein [Burkholderiales bacterium]
MHKRVHPEVVDIGTSAGIVSAPESEVIWECSEGQVVNAGWIVFGLLGFWLILPLVMALWRIWQTSRHTYSLTSQRLRERVGVLNRDVEELELYRVKDLSVHQPLLQQVLGLGQVILITSDRSTPRVVLNAVPNPVGVADLIRRNVEACRVAKGVREID